MDGYRIIKKKLLVIFLVVCVGGASLAWAGLLQQRLKVVLARKNAPPPAPSDFVFTVTVTGPDTFTVPIYNGGTYDFEIDCDVAVMAVGLLANQILTKATPRIKVDKWGDVLVNPDTMETSIKGVYAGGDIVTGAATVILAMGAGLNAAKAIDASLKNQDLGVSKPLHLSQFMESDKKYRVSYTPSIDLVQPLVHLCKGFDVVKINVGADIKTGSLLPLSTLIASPACD